MSVTAVVGIIQGIVAILVIVIAAVVGRATAQKIARERYVETIDELQKIADTRLEVISERDRKLHDLETRSFDLNKRVGQLEGFNRRLLEDQYIDREYVRVLVALLHEHKIVVPPREMR